LIESAGFVVDFSTYFFTFLIFPIFFLRSLPYRLGLVRNFNEKWFIRQLKPGIPLLDHVSNRLVNWELKPLARKKSIPFGASLIVMAHKK
jgi:hypothetical protein